MSSRFSTSHRASIYYWKCDRPIAFHGTSGRHDHAVLTQQITDIIEDHFSAKAEVHPGPGQGNHITFSAICDGQPLFIRIDDGPENDDYLAVESALQETIRSLGLSTPVVHAVDASRQFVPFAWQIMQRIDAPDLNHHFKNGSLDFPTIAREIGSAIAQWQAFQPSGFGPFNPGMLQSANPLQGFHATYEDYFFLHFERHLHYLTQNNFLSTDEASALEHEVMAHQSLLNLSQGCLVHKDLALWNILGSPNHIEAFIDWDDSISGDPMDDFSLFACFHNANVILPALESYQATRALPADYERRFWLHLLRNMLVKAVIRTGAGYFNRGSSFFLINDGIDLKTFTHQRLFQALQGLRSGAPISTLR